MRRNNRARPECFQLRLSRPTHVGIDLDCCRLDYVCLAPDQPQLRSEAHGCLPKLKPSAARRCYSVDQRGRALCIDMYPTFSHSAESHLRWVLVFYNQPNRAIGGVLNVNAYFGFCSHCEAAAKLAKDR